MGQGPFADFWKPQSLCSPCPTEQDKNPQLALHELYLKPHICVGPCCELTDCVEGPGSSARLKLHYHGCSVCRACAAKRVSTSVLCYAGEVSLCPHPCLPWILLPGPAPGKSTSSETSLIVQSWISQPELLIISSPACQVLCCLWLELFLSWESCLLLWKVWQSLSD